MIYLLLALSSIFLCQFAVGFINAPPLLHNNKISTHRCTSCYTTPTTTILLSSPLDDFLGNIFGKDDDKSVNSKEDISDNTPLNNIKEEEVINEISLSSFQNELAKREEEESSNIEEEEEFDGYALRDCIFAKYGVCFDVEFQRVDSYGFRTVYLVSCYEVYVPCAYNVKGDISHLTSYISSSV